MQKRVGCYIDDNEVATTMNVTIADMTHGTVGLAGGRAKCAEILLAMQVFCCLIHRNKIEFVSVPCHQPMQCGRPN